MPLPVLPIMAAGGVLLFLAAGDDDDPGAPGPTVPPGPEGFTPGALDALTEIRTVGGQPCRYFRGPVAQAVLGMLGQSHAAPLPPMVEADNPLPAPVPPGAAAFFQVVPRTVQTSALPTAAQAIALAAQQGLSVLGTLTLPIPQDSGNRWLAICQPTAVSTLARVDTKWAVLLDPARKHMPTPPPQGTPPGPGGDYPPPPPPPPPTPSPFPADDVPPYGGPPGMPPPPPPPPPFPGMPGDDGLDADMPAALRKEIEGMLADKGMAPEALEEMADDIEGDYPIAATALRARAAELRAVAKAKAIAEGGYPFTIRSGDLPYKVAQHYTGDASRWKEIPAANPGMEIVTVNGVTQLKPWHGEILLPTAWEPWNKGLPAVATGGPGPAPSDDDEDDDWAGPPYRAGVSKADVAKNTELGLVVTPSKGYGPAPKVSGKPAPRRRRKKGTS